MWERATAYGGGSFIRLRHAHVHALIESGRSAQALEVAQDTAALLDGHDHALAAGPAAVALGAALLATGSATAGRTEIETGMAITDGIEGVLVPAQTRMLAGEALLRAGDRGRARHFLGDARERFAGMGATVLEERARAGLRRAGIRVSAATGRPAPDGRMAADPLHALTARERAAAELAAGGASSRIIAQRLGISERTVENHLGSAYAKLRLHGRAELIALVARRAAG
jgi:DNA-binding CsgD family transcriptional regulator